MLINWREMVDALRGQVPESGKEKRLNKEALAAAIKEHVAEEQARMEAERTEAAEEILGVILHHIEEKKFTVRDDGSILVNGYMRIGNDGDIIGTRMFIHKPDWKFGFLAQRLAEYDLYLVSYEMGTAHLQLMNQGAES